MKRGRKTFSVMLAQVCCAAFVAALAGAVAGCAASEDGAQHPNDGGSVDAGTGGSSAGTGGSSVGSGGSSAGSGGSSVGSGGTGTGTDGGGSGGSIVSPPDANDAGGTGLGPFGITSCQPKFEQACKPPIVFANQDPADKGKVFTDAVPDVTKAEQEIACTACSIIYRDPSEIPSNKHPSQIKIVLDTHGGVAQAGGDQIQFDLNYIAGFKGKNPADVKQEMLGVLQHETVHLYQNYGNSGTGEGLADLVRARTGFYPKSRFRKGEGTWKDAYTASGNFYSWLTGPCSFHSTFYPQHDLDLPYKLNKALAGKSGDDAYAAVAALLQATFGKGPDELWTAYQNTAF
ncbi:MAG: hypothetical protein QOI66_2145 [Myxococcales bacterium]|nr:hypothetical protein [Myxococcales bacterium]